MGSQQPGRKWYFDASRATNRVVRLECQFYLALYKYEHPGAEAEFASAYINRSDRSRTYSLIYELGLHEVFKRQLHLTLIPFSFGCSPCFLLSNHFDVTRLASPIASCQMKTPSLYHRYMIHIVLKTSRRQSLWLQRPDQLPEAWQLKFQPYLPVTYFSMPGKRVSQAKMETGNRKQIYSSRCESQDITLYIFLCYDIGQGLSLYSSCRVSWDITLCLAFIFCNNDKQQQISYGHSISELYENIMN